MQNFCLTCHVLKPDGQVTYGVMALLCFRIDYQDLRPVTIKHTLYKITNFCIKNVGCNGLALMHGCAVIKLGLFVSSVYLLSLGKIFSTQVLID